MNDLIKYEEILNEILHHVSTIKQTGLVNNLTPTELIAQVASEMALLEKVGNLDAYKEQFIDPYVNEETMGEIETRIEAVLEKPKGTLH